MAVTRQTLRHIARLRNDLDAILNGTTRTLVGAWADAFDEVKADLDTAVRDLLDAAKDGRVTRAQAMRSQRLARALAKVSSRLQRLADTAGVTITGDLEGVVERTIAAQADIVATQLPAGERELVDAWSRVDDRQIEAIVNRSTKAIVSGLDPLPGDVMSVVRRELIRGVAAGTNPRATARRMVARVEGHVNGRWGLSRALTIARTETISAHREAALQSRKANADVLAGWRWQCDLSARTCPACLSKHGETYSVDTPGPDGHPNCRCTAALITRSWKDLGFDVEEPADIFPDARQWFDAQPEATQVAIMGQQRLDLLKSGDVSWDALATKQRNPGWRDSWQVTPLKTLARKRAA